MFNPLSVAKSEIQFSDRSVSSDELCSSATNPFLTITFGTLVRCRSKQHTDEVILRALHYQRRSMTFMTWDAEKQSYRRLIRPCCRGTTSIHIYFLSALLCFVSIYYLLRPAYTYIFCSYQQTNSVLPVILALSIATSRYPSRVKPFLCKTYSNMLRKVYQMIKRD